MVARPSVRRAPGAAMLGLQPASRPVPSRPHSEAAVVVVVSFARRRRPHLWLLREPKQEQTNKHTPIPTNQEEEGTKQTVPPHPTCSTVSRISPLGTYFSARSAIARASATAARARRRRDRHDERAARRRRLDGHDARALVGSERGEVILTIPHDDT